MEEKDISQAVIGRLPRYFRYLGELKDEGVERISSQDLSELMKVTASQIRQDFNNFGGFGQQGYGYNVELPQQVPPKDRAPPRQLPQYIYNLRQQVVFRIVTLYYVLWQV